MTAKPRAGSGKKRPCPGEVPWQHPCCGARSVVVVFPDRMSPPGKKRFLSPGHGQNRQMSVSCLLRLSVRR
jgi:hypothetical protein